MTSPEFQREFALQIVQQLREAGYQSLWAGGCVRDQLLGRSPEDYDVATNARPEEVRELFGKRRTLAIGAAFGVIAVLGRKSQPPIEVATFRSDGAYVDGRRPQGVIFTTAKQDAQRRDFTINGMFFDPVDEQIIDYVGGEADLQQGLVRAIGDPAARFAEDKLRMLRAVRFATTLGFQIDASTRAAIIDMAQETNVVSAERIGAELRRLLVHPSRSAGVALLSETGLLKILLPEVAAVAAEDGCSWQRLLEQLERLKSDSLSVALAALLHDSENPSLIGEIGRRFRFTNREIDRARWLVQNLPQVTEAERIPWPKLQRVLIHEGAADLVALAIAELGAEHSGVQHSRHKLALPTKELDPEPLVAGEDLIAHGISPGPRFSAILDYIRDEQLLGNISTRQEALELADLWQREHLS